MATNEFTKTVNTEKGGYDYYYDIGMRMCGGDKNLAHEFANRCVEEDKKINN